jgi:hypothetical protein
MSRLKPQPSLERIIGFLTDIKGDCFKTFSRHPNLQGLDFYDCGIKEENLKYLAACPKLTYVDFHHTDMGEIGIKYLSQCANLSEVHVKNNARINDACLKYLLNLKHLSYLELDSTGVTFNGLKVLKPLKLNKLTISEGVCDVKDLPALKTLAKTIEIVPRSHKVDKSMQQILAPLH